MKEGRRITIEEVAKLAGVSIATVSRVINNYPHVSEKVRAKVREAIRGLDYQPSVFAQRLAGKFLKIISLVIPSYEGMFYSYYGNEIIRSVAEASTYLNYDLLLHTSSQSRPLNITTADGVIFADIIGNEEELRECLQHNEPCVVINRVMEMNSVSYVGIDNFQGAFDAVSYLISLGHKEIAHISGDLRVQCARQRKDGYLRALKQNTIEIKEDFIKTGDFSPLSARRATEELLALKSRPTAIFCASDEMAQEVISVIHEQRLEVPKDISIIGFDDSPVCISGSIGISTVRQPLREMARKGIEILDTLISGNKEPQKVLLPCRLIIRETCDFLE